MCECGAVVEYWALYLKVGGSNPPLLHLIFFMHPTNFIGKYTSIYSNVYVKIPRHKVAEKLTSVYGNVYVKITRHTKCRKIFHGSMGNCVGKFLEIQNICETLVW
jgi:hypothetical protein